MRRSLVLAIVMSLAAAGAAYAQSAKVDYPAGYRNWNHVKSMVILPGHPLADPFAGIHHVYANAKATRGLRTGRYADGAVLVFDLLEGGVKDSAVAEGKRKFIGVMQRDEQRFAATGGWGYEAFAGDSRSERAVKDGGNSCAACHAGQKDKGGVFSAMRK